MLNLIYLDNQQPKSDNGQFVFLSISEGQLQLQVKPGNQENILYSFQA